MWCNKCGKPIQPDDTFCMNCGTALRNSLSNQANQPSRVQTLAAERPTAAPQKASTEAYYQLTRDSFGKNARSVLYLIAVICYSMAVLINFGSIQDGGGLSVLYDLFEEMGLSKRMINQTFSGLEDFMTGIGFVMMIPSILTVVSLWLIYAGGFAEGEKRLCACGLTILKVLQIISLVSIIFSSFFCFGALFSACSALSEYSSEAQSALTTAIFILMGVYAIVILVIIKTLATLTSLKRAAVDGVPEEVPSFIGVYCIISGALSSLTVFSAFSFSTLLQSTAMILFGIQLFMYKSAMSAVEHSRSGNEGAYRSIIKRASIQTTSSGEVFSYQPQDGVPTWKKVEIMEAEAMKAAQKEIGTLKCVYCGARMLEEQVFCGACGKRKD